MRFVPLSIILDASVGTTTTLIWTDVTTFVAHVPIYTLYRAEGSSDTFEVLYVGQNVTFEDDETPAFGLDFRYYVVAQIGSVQVVSNIISVGGLIEAGHFTSWGQIDIHPFNIPFGADSEKTFAELT